MHIQNTRSEPFPTTPLSSFSAVLNRKLWLFLLRCPFSNLPKVVLHLLRAAQNSFNFFQHAKRNYGLIFKRACLLFITLYISTLNIISYLPTHVTSRKVVHSFKKDISQCRKKVTPTLQLLTPKPLLCLENEASLDTCQNKKQNRSKLNFPKKVWLACDFSVDFHPL